MTSIVTLTSKNQITLPVKLVNFWNLAKGMKLEITINSGIIQMKKATSNWEDLHGYLVDEPMAKKYSIDEVIQKASKVEAKRLMNAT